MAAKLTTRELLELGWRLTADTLEELGLLQAVLEAGATMREALATVGQVGDRHGSDVKALELALLGTSAWRAFRFPKRNPTPNSSKYGMEKAPEPLSLWEGESTNNPVRRGRALGLPGHKILVFQDPNPEVVYISWSRATKDAVDFLGPHETFWEEIGVVDPSDLVGDMG